MAQGDVVVFEEAKLAFLDGSIDLSGTTDFSCLLVTTLPVASVGTPDTSDYTECTQGGGYTTGGIALTISLAEAGGTVTFDDSVNPSWTKAAGSPTDVVAAIVYSETATPDAVCFIDLTTDAGSTPVSLVDNDITITWDDLGIFTLA